MLEWPEGLGASPCRCTATSFIWTAKATDILAKVMRPGGAQYLTVQSV